MVRVQSELSGAVRHALLSTLLGLRNGFQYGVKIRAPHSLVMTFLFKPNHPIKENLLGILKMTFAHARNLGGFVLIYKSLLSALRVLYTAAGAKINTAGGEPARCSQCLYAAVTQNLLLPARLVACLRDCADSGTRPWQAGLALTWCGLSIAASMSRSAFTSFLG
mmetsp:Transcript_14194/g.22070  ORF Transcript_14194/g.22070 Transcript_14194/m.22070 type:complete len:165 (+) Transcript_14194:159-653(+)